tara:strand:- start:1042 stop:1521 length:480 start_codon:yes stop_codon:yes gene_type:complete
MSSIQNIKNEICGYDQAIMLMEKERAKRIVRHNFIELFHWDFETMGEVDVTADFNKVGNLCEGNLKVMFSFIEKPGFLPGFIDSSKIGYLKIKYSEDTSEFPSTINCDIQGTLEGHLLLTKGKIYIPTDLTACDRDDYMKLKSLIHTLVVRSTTILKPL